MKNRLMLYIVSLSVISASVTFFSFRITDVLDTHAEIYQKTKIFTEILVKIVDEYVDEKDSDVLIDKAINAMMQELDPHSNFLPPREFGQMSDRFMGYEGIGIQFRMLESKITVMHVLRGGPSERAGLKLGDRIIKIEGNDAIGLGQNDVPPLLKGPAGTRVSVTIERPGVGEFDVTITRGQAFVESIKYYYMVDDSTGYIYLETFSRTTTRELERALRHLEGQGMKRLVFDLRENTGGLLPQAIEVSDKFLSGNKLIVKTKGRMPSATGEFNSTDSPADIKYPMIVLIDEQSASASEIVSGALQDWDRALIVGKRSFGKGLVQSQTQFDDQSALLLTIGRWYTPLGRLIQKDYQNKSRTQYRIDAFSDSANTALNRNAGLPKFATPMGRTVYGGGGITPDFVVDPNFVMSPTVYLFSPPVRSLVVDNQSDEPFFRYAQQYSVENANTWSSVEHFIDEYDFSGVQYENYIKFLHDEGFKFDESKFDDESKKIIEWNIKNRIAEFLWGDIGRIKAAATEYDVLWKALEYFPEAEKLAKN